MDKPMPKWMRYALVFSSVTYVASALAYIVSVELVCGLVAVIAVRRMEGRA